MVNTNLIPCLKDLTCLNHNFKKQKINLFKLLKIHKQLEIYHKMGHLIKIKIIYNNPVGDFEFDRRVILQVNQ